jgi:hypothetical protein
MKKITKIFLLTIFSVSLFLGIVGIVTEDLQSEQCPEKCHLVYDTIDKMFYCVGSPLDCCCDN